MILHKILLNVKSFGIGDLVFAGEILLVGIGIKDSNSHKASIRQIQDKILLPIKIFSNVCIVTFEIVILTRIFLEVLNVFQNKILPPDVLNILRISSSIFLFLSILGFIYLIVQNIKSPPTSKFTSRAISLIEVPLNSKPKKF